MSKRHVQTFYPDAHTEKIYTEMFPEQRLNFNDSGEASVAADFVLEEGQHYVVCFDRVNYELEVSGGVIANDLFSIFVDGDQMTVRVASAGTHTVRLTVCEEVVQEIEGKYLPDGLPSVTEGETKTVPATFTYDGSVKGVEFDWIDGNCFVKASDFVPPVESLSAGLAVIYDYFLGDDETPGTTGEINVTDVIDLTGDGSVYRIEHHSEQPSVPVVGAYDYLLATVVYRPGIYFADPEAGAPGTYLSKGIYLGTSVEGAFNGATTADVWTSFLSFPGVTYEETQTTVHKLDARCLPDDMRGLALTSPAGYKYYVSVSDEGTLEVSMLAAPLPIPEAE